MTIEKLIANLQAYYEQRYRPLVAKELEQALKGEPDEYLDFVYSVFVREFLTQQWKQLPDVATYKQHKSIIINEYDAYRRKSQRPTTALQIEYQEKLTEDEIQEISNMARDFLKRRPGAAKKLFAAINYQPEDES